MKTICRFLIILSLFSCDGGDDTPKPTILHGKVVYSDNGEPYSMAKIVVKYSPSQPLQILKLFVKKDSANVAIDGSFHFEFEYDQDVYYYRLSPMLTSENSSQLSRIKFVSCTNFCNEYQQGKTYDIIIEVER